MKNTTIKPIQACEQFFKSGKIHALTFNYPSFSIDEKTFKYFTLDAVEEKFRQAETSNGNVDFDELNKIINSQHPKYLLEAQDIVKKALTSALTITAQTKLTELSNANETIIFSTTSEKIGLVHEKNKFAATLLMIKNSFDDKNFYNRVIESLENHQDHLLLKEIKALVNNPKMDVVSHIYKIDPKMAIEYFPKETKDILSMEKPTLLNKQKLA